MHFHFQRGISPLTYSSPKVSLNFGAVHFNTCHKGFFLNQPKINKRSPAWSSAWEAKRGSMLFYQGKRCGMPPNLMSETDEANELHSHQK